MAKKRRTSGPIPSKTLRQRAERMASTTGADIAEMKDEDVRRLVHELQVHQIELELQNQELREAQVALAEARDRYADLYEFAPVGYLSVGPDGVIHEANLTAAKLLARERVSLIGTKLSHFVARQSQDAFFLRWRETLQSQVRTTCDLQMTRPDAPELEAQLDIVPRPGDSLTAGASRITEVRVMLSDITERRLAEEARDEIEQRLALAASATGIGMSQWNIATGEILGTEQQALLLGLTTTTTTTTTLSRSYHRNDWAERVHPEDLPRVEAELRRSMADRTPYEAEYRIVWPDGSMHWIASRGVFEYDAQRQPERMLGIAMDVTERKQVEARLREIEERWKFALQATDVGAWRLDLVDHTAWRSLRHDQIFGYEELLPEWTYETFLEHVLEEDRARVDQRFQQALAHRQDWSFECRIRRADGQVRWIWAQGRSVADAQGQLVQMFGLVQDITERKQAEEALRDLNEDLERKVTERTGALAMLSDVASMANDATDVEAAIVYALKRVSEYNGWKCGHAWLPADEDPDELLPGYVWYEEAPARFDRLQERILACRLKRGDGLVGRVFSSGKPEFTNDVGAHLSIYRAPLAEHVGVQTACAFPIFAGKERIVGVIEFFAEKHIVPTKQRLTYMASVGTLVGRVIERKRAEQALREMNETLRQRARDLQSLAAQLALAEQYERSRLANLLHDDLQQLLVAASLRLSCLAEDAQDERKQDFAKIDALLQDCQMISRDLSHELSPPILKRGTLADVVTWLAQWFGDKHALTVAVDAPREAPAASEHLRIFLFQAVRELLFNAVKHSGSGKVRVILSCQDDDVTVQVEDGGVCFDPHAVTAHCGRPEGLGLLSIQERLQALGGRLEIERTRQGGACVRLVVPLAGGTKPLAESAEPEGVEMVTCGDSRFRRVIRLLVVDDHALVREGFVSLLNRQPDLKVVGEAADGAEAIQRAEELLPDVVLMDVDMPTMDGMEATRRLTEQHANIAVIALSLHEDKSVSRAMTAAGADAYVSKRAAVKDLVEAIHRVCDGSATPG